jgi:hypothetical protein
MRIAQVAPLTEAGPPKLYGGTERVIHWLTEELVALGNDVTLFASGDRRSRRTHSLSPNLGRTPSPICPDLISDRHNGHRKTCSNSPRISPPDARHVGRSINFGM